MNAINLNIQFTVKHQTIAFLYTIFTILGDGQYLAFDSHGQLQSKAAVVKTLLDCANVIPSNVHKRQEEICKVVKDLRIIGCMHKFIDELNSHTKKIQEQPQQFKGLTCIPYVKGISERVEHIMSSAAVTGKSVAWKLSQRQYFQGNLVAQ